MATAAMVLIFAVLMVALTGPPVALAYYSYRSEGHSPPVLRESG